MSLLVICNNVDVTSMSSFRDTCVSICFANVAFLLTSCRFLVYLCIMNSSDFWSTVRPNDKSPWLKMPYWIFPFLRSVNICDSELFVLIFLISEIKDGLSDVYAHTTVGTRFCNIDKRSYYRAIEKFKQMGLVKKGNGVYDLTGLVEFFRSQLVISGQVPLEVEE